MHFKILSAIRLNLDQSKILSPGNGLTLYQTTKFRQVQTESICRRQNKCDLEIEI